MKKDFQSFNPDYDGTDETGRFVSLFAVLFCIFLAFIITIGVLGEAAGAGNQRGYYATAVPAQQIYIDVDTDGGCIGCVWNR